MRFKRFLLCSALTLGFVVSAPPPAKADPVTAAIVTYVGLSGTAAAVATFVINTAISMAVSWGASKLLGKGKTAVAERQASVQSLSLGEVPREALIGETITGGSLVDVFNHGGQYGTDYVTRCIALADHKVDALVGYYVDDVFYAWLGNGQQAGFGGALDMEFVNASADGTPPPARWLAASGWSNLDVGVGVARIWVSCKFDEKVWPQGLPAIRFVLRGLRAYDPRKDTALGYVGSDAQSWGNSATHAWTRNATLARYAIVRGIYAEGRHGQSEHLLIGRGLTADEAPPQRIVAPANLCDEDVDGPFNAGQTQYMASGTVRASDTFIAVEEMFAAAMAGVIVQREGGVEIEPGQAKAAVVTITDGDLVVGEPVTFSAFLTDGDGGRINTVVPRYVEPSQNWKDFAGPVRRDLDDIAEDRGPREMTLSLMLVTSGRQADWCAEIVRRSSRLERRATIVLPPDYAMLEEGDWIAWQSDRRHGGSTVRYQVAGWSMDASWRMRLSLREIASSVYGVPDPIEDTAEAPPPPVPVDALTLPGADAEAITLAGDTGVIPGVRFTWDIPVDAAVRAVLGEVRVLGQTQTSSTRSDTPDEGVMIATNGVMPRQQIQARLVPIGDPTRPVLPSAWVTLSTGELVADDVSLTGPNIAAQIARVDALVETYGDTVAAEASALAAAAAASAAEAAKVAAQTAKDQSLSGASSSAGSATVATTKAGEASVSAAAAAADRLGAQTANTNAGIARDAAVAAQSGAAGSQAAAGTSASLAARVGLGGGSFANASPSFAAGAVSGAVPTGWSSWVNSTANTVVAGQISDKAIRWVVAANVNAGLLAASTTAGNFNGRPGPGWWVVEALVTLESGSLQGSGWYLEPFAPGFGAVEPQSGSFAADSDSTGAAPGTGSPGRTYAFSKLFRLTSPSISDFNFFMMSSWNGLGAQPAKTIVFHLCGVRRATAAEIETGIARSGYATVAARISAEETVRASETAALASRATTSEARAVSQPNKAKNSAFDQGFRYWAPFAAQVFTDSTVGNFAYISAAGAQYLISDTISGNAGQQYTVSWNAEVAGPSAGFWVAYYSGATYITDETQLFFANAGWAARGTYTFTMSAGANGFKLVAHKPAASTYLGITRLMVNPGPLALPWNDQASVVDIASRTSITESNVADAQAKLNVARLALLATATGSEPAYMQLLSGTYGSNIALVAQQIALAASVNGTPVPILTLSAGRGRFTGNLDIDGNLLITGSINGKRTIENRTITNTLSFFNESQNNLANRTYNTYAQLTFTSTGNKHIVSVNLEVHIWHPAAAACQFRVQVQRAGFVVLNRRMQVPGDYMDTSLHYEFDDTPGPGSHTYEVRCQYDADSNANEAWVEGKSLRITELKTEA